MHPERGGAVAKTSTAAARSSTLDARSLRDLGLIPGNHLEALRRERMGQHGIRINAKYRICFRWVEGEAAGVEIADYH